MLRMKHHRFLVEAPSGTEFTVQFRSNARARRLILKIDPKSGDPVVIAPSERHAKAAEKFVKAKAGWIEAQLSKQPEGLALTPGTTIPIKGVPHQLVHRDGRGKTRYVEGTTPVLESPGAEITFADRVQRFLRLEAKTAILERLDIHAQRLAVDPRKVTIRDTVSRWGSCSAKGHLNFSWRLILAPPRILDYVVAHEAAHLIEMNHSPAFWAQVEKTYGPHKSARSWLKQHGRLLHSVGKGGSSGG
ncbi:MAG: metal-dependent hydrolase [Ponticaulis sp.]|nr:metal-dependent hydrolase [Ponticaulis sp.]